MTSSLERIARGLTSNTPTSLSEAIKTDDRTRILLSDTSDSMDDLTEGREKRKIDALREVVYGIRDQGIAFRQIVFGGSVEMREDIPEPSGGTPLLEALKLSRRYEPGRLVVISDGIPENPEGCIALATEMGVPIDTFYVGPRPHMGEAFMSKLSAATGGTSHVGDLGKSVKMLQGEMAKALLALPPAPAIIL